MTPTNQERNAFYALAKALWAQGEDGEVIARDLALSFKRIVEEAVGVGHATEEFNRLIREGSE